MRMDYRKIVLATLAVGLLSIPQVSIAAQKENEVMQYSIASQSKKHVIGIQVRTSNSDGQFQKDVVPLWKRFYRENLADKIPNRTNQNLMVVYTDYEGDYTKPFTCLIGCEVSNLTSIPLGLTGIEIPNASYAIFTAKGEFPDSLIQTWHTIWASQIKRAYSTDFEIYPSDFDPQKNPAINVYIALKHP